MDEHNQFEKWFSWSRILLCVFAFCASSALWAQTGGQGAIKGTITDPSGAVVAGATVTATNLATGIVTTHTSSADGIYLISPIIPGTYSVTVTATGFREFKLESLVVDAMQVTGFDINLSVGAADESVTVSSAPPQLETTSSTLSGVMENQTYQSLPVLMGGQQRDATAFANLMPGAQPGTRTPIIGGTGNFLAEVYLDGLPLDTVNQQGDNRIVFNAVPVDAIDQFQVITSVAGAQYQGAGLINFTVKSGGNKYHGSVVDFVRARMFDTWGFTAPAATIKNSAGQTVPAGKPDEHQNELAGTFGGPIPLTKQKGFFFVTYDRYHGRSGVNPQSLTVPTLKMRQGDFSELNAPIYDPTTQAACTSHNTDKTPCRYQYGYVYSGTPGKNGSPQLSGTPNVIPASQLSPIAQYMQKFLPDPSNSSIVNNYLGGVPSGFDNWEFVTRVDYNLTANHRLAYVMAIGDRKNVPFTVGSNASNAAAGVVLPVPYTNGGKAEIKPTIMDVEDSYVFTPNLVNQLEFGFTRFAQPVTSITDGVAQYAATAAGITNLPQGQASTELPGASFGTSTLFPTVQSQWTSNGASGATQTTVPNAFTLIDNLQWVKGRHSMVMGLQMQWLEDNVAAQLSHSGILTMAYNANSTAGFTPNSQALATTAGGYSYASYMLGAIGGTPSIQIQPFSETGGRYHTISPYFQDDWKVSSKLTLNLGLRWDYFPPFHEVQDRWSFLNPTMINPATGTPGALQFAGNRGAGFSCNCRTPVNTYWKNFGPRVGFAYEVNSKTVLRGGAAVAYSHAGGVGGRGGAGSGTGQLGFNVNAAAPTEITSGATAGPSFYLNNSAGFQAAGLANTAYGGPGYVLPTPSAPSAASEILNSGNYLNNGKLVTAAAAPGYADPYISGRAPEFIFFSFGFQRALTNDLVIAANYAGSESHFVVPSGSNIRGYWANQLNPSYLAGLGGLASADGKQPLLSAPATQANVNVAQAAMPGIQIPQVFSTAAVGNNSLTIAQMLKAFPQYTTVSDTWGQNSANISYHSFQLTLQQRPWNGLSYTVNYTYSKNIGDDGTFRSGFAIPAGAMSDGSSWKQDRIERGVTLTHVPQNLSVFGVYQLPFGKGKIGGNNFLVRTLAGGWQFSSIYYYRSGAPLAVNWGGCTAPTPTTGQGQCMPDLNPSFSGPARINGSWGKHITAANLGAIQYINPNAFSTPNVFASPSGAPPFNKIGNAPRTRALGLVNPSTQNMDASIRRSFNLTPERVVLTLQADCSNVANKVTFGSIANGWGPGSTSFGAVGNATGNRDWQFGGHVVF